MIPAERLLDFRRGVQCDAATEFYVYSSYKKGKGTSTAGALYPNKTIWHCFCGPEDNSLDPKEKFAKLASVAATASHAALAPRLPAVAARGADVCRYCQGGSSAACLSPCRGVMTRQDILSHERSSKPYSS